MSQPVFQHYAGPKEAAQAAALQLAASAREAIAARGVFIMAFAITAISVSVVGSLGSSASGSELSSESLV